MNSKLEHVDRLINLQDVMYLTGVSRSQIYNLIALKRLPAAISLSSGKSNRCSRWSLNEINDWIEQKKSNRAVA